MANPTAETPLEELQALQAYFRTATAGLQQGEVIRLEGMMERVAAVCNAVQHGSPELQQECLPELTALIELLHLYEMELKMLQTLTEQQMKTSNDT